MPASSPIARTRTGLSAWFGIVLSLVAAFGTSAHVLLVKHELCDAHGALVEDRADGAHDDNASEDSSSGDTHDGDVHCPLGVAATALVPAAPPALEDPKPIVALGVAVPAVASEVRTQDPLRVAPKTSPPAR